MSRSRMWVAVFGVLGSIVVAGSWWGRGGAGAAPGASAAPNPGSSCKYTVQVDLKTSFPTTYSIPCEEGEHTHCYWNEPPPKPKQPVNGFEIETQNATVSGKCKFTYALDKDKKKTTWRLFLDDKDPKSLTAAYKALTSNSASGEHGAALMSKPTALGGYFSSDGEGAISIRGKIDSSASRISWNKTVGDGDGKCHPIKCVSEETTDHATAGSVDFTLPGLTAPGSTPKMKVSPEPTEVWNHLRDGTPFTITATGQAMVNLGNSTTVARSTVTVELMDKPRCGPDITAALTGTVAKLRKQWATFSMAKKLEVCLAFYDPATAWAGWDIGGMHHDTEWTKGGDADCARPDFSKGCGSTVVVNDKCFYTGSVNYILLGLYGRLCEDTPSWLQGDTYQHLIDLWKFEWPILQGDSPSADFEAATRWAAAGYAGWPGADTPEADRPRCERTCTASFAAVYPFVTTVPGTLGVNVRPGFHDF